MPTASGQSTFQFMCRILGAVAAMTASYVIWYIVDGHRAGVIVFAWVFMFAEFYCVIKFPRFIAVWLMALTSQNLILGYELQVDKIGQAAAATSGNPYYP